MQLYSLYVIAVCVIILISIEIIRFFYRKTNKFYSQHENVINLIKKIPNQLDIVSIGSGPGKHGIIFEDAVANGYNLCTSPQSLKYSFRLLKKFSKKIKRNATIIIIVCPLSFGNNADTKSDNYSDKFYGILSPSQIDGYSLKKALHLHYSFLIDILKITNKYTKSSKTAQKNTSTVTVVDVWKSQFDLIDLENPHQAEKHKKAFDEKVEILSNGIDFCIKMNYRPVIVIPPIPYKTRKHFSDAFLKKFLYENIYKINILHKNISVLDYLFDKRFGDNIFKNDIFLSEIGAKKFSSILFDDIKKIMKEGNIQKSDRDFTVVHKKIDSCSY